MYSKLNIVYFQFFQFYLETQYYFSFVCNGKQTTFFFTKKKVCWERVHTPALNRYNPRKSVFLRPKAFQIVCSSTGLRRIFETVISDTISGHNFSSDIGVGINILKLNLKPGHEQRSPRNVMGGALSSNNVVGIHMIGTLWIAQQNIQGNWNATTVLGLCK